VGIGFYGLYVFLSNFVGFIKSWTGNGHLRAELRSFLANVFVTIVAKCTLYQQSCSLHQAQLYHVKTTF